MGDLNEKEIKPPYLSFTTVRNFLNSVREAGLPSRIDKSLMAGQSGATQSYLISALKFLQFIDDQGVPIQNLRDWVGEVREDDEILKGAIERGYAFLFDGDLDVKNGTQAQLDEKFRELNLTGSTVRKAVTFFVAATEAAGIEISQHFKAKRAGTGGSSRRRTKRRPANDVHPAETPQTATQESLSGHDVAVLRLNASGSRCIKLQAPPTVTREELQRIQQWMSFQLIVTEDVVDDDDDDLR